MSLDKATVARIAHLARIKLAPDQIDPMVNELNAILTWVEQLSELDTENVPPMTGVEHEGLRQRV
ncbi:MAG: Asp-tRNA(Asn)/Glu-tRNA(Gln) amidotransferase subunit GatC, partial [Pseudomonadota bacterium]